MKRLMVGFFIIIVSSLSINADCVYGMKDKSSFIVLDNHSVILKGRFGSDILIKTYCYISSSSSIQILKDDFCDYESAVMYIDNEACDVNQVKKLW